MKEKGIDIAKAATPVFALARKAIEAGNKEEALKWLDEAHRLADLNNDGLCRFIEQTLTMLGSYDEEALPRVFRSRYGKAIQDWIALKLTPEQTVMKCMGSQIRHGSTPVLTEDDEKFIVTYDPCASGGRMRRIGNMGATKKAYPWSWSKSGVPYYCTHCCVHFEIVPTEIQGYPIRINLTPEKPSDPCVHLFYKKPELIPEKYFKRIGLTKKIKSK